MAQEPGTSAGHGRARRDATFVTTSCRSSEIDPRLDPPVRCTGLGERPSSGPRPDDGQGRLPVYVGDLPCCRSRPNHRDQPLRSDQAAAGGSPPRRAVGDCGRLRLRSRPMPPRVSRAWSSSPRPAACDKAKRSGSRSATSTSNGRQFMSTSSSSHSAEPPRSDHRRPRPAFAPFPFRMSRSSSSNTTSTDRRWTPEPQPASCSRPNTANRSSRTDSRKSGAEPSQRAGLPAGTGFHALRHYYASLLIRHGESVIVVQARLGHASAAQTLDTYSHLWPDAADRTREAVDTVLGEALRRSQPIQPNGAGPSRRALGIRPGTGRRPRCRTLVSLLGVRTARSLSWCA